MNDTPRARRAAATRERLLAEAMGLVQQTGLSGLSIHGLARAADYTPGALYRYFASKDALIAALTVRVLERFGAVGTRVRERLAGDALTNALATLLTYRDLARAAPEEFGLLSKIIADPRVLVPDDADAAPVVDVINAQLTPIAEVLGLARAWSLFSAVHGVLVMRKQERRAPGLNFNELLLDLIRGVCAGWGLPTEPTELALAQVAAVGDLVDYAGGLP